MNFPKHFIAATKEFTTREHAVPAPYMRRAFKLSALPKAAKLTICGLGFYELWINGEKITRGWLSPTVSNSDKLVYYDVYDVLPFLREGENVVGVCLGNGFQNNPYGNIWKFDEASFRSAPKVALALEMPDLVIDSSEGFLCKSSPIIFDDYRAGEYFDANREIKGWTEPNFDDSDWESAIKAETPRGEAKLNKAFPIKTVREIAPVAINKLNDGYIYDFGVNTSGLCRLKIDAKSGQEITMQFGEWLNPDGSLDISTINFQSNNTDFIQKDIYICKDGMQEWTPMFTYHGFRYVWVKGLTAEQAKPETLTYLEFYTALEECADFRCSNETINRLQEMTRRSVLSNFHHFLTDCPHREKNGWTGDSFASGEHILLNLFADENFKQWLENVRYEMRIDGAIPGIVPTTGWGFECEEGWVKTWNGTAWDGALILLPYFMYLYRGDTEVLKDNAHAILRYLEYLTSIANDDGLIEIGLGDWCQVNREETDYVAPLVVLDSILAMDLCNKSAKIFNVLGKSLHEKFATDFAMNLKKAIRDKLVDLDTKTVSGNCQTSQAIALHYGVFEENECAEAFERLLEMIEVDGNVMNVGIIGGKVLFHVLSDYGRADLAFDMIIGPQFPSYGYLVEKGATTLHENFFEDLNEVKSMNHHFWGDISHWFIRHLAGINYAESKLTIKPNFIKELDNAYAYFIVPEGKIEVSWERRCKSIELSLSVPEGISGKIQLRDGYVLNNGKKCAQAVSGEYEIKKV